MDKRSNRVQPIRLLPNYFALDIHKSMFINELMITIPSFYVHSWGQKVINQHNKNNYKFELDLEYESPKDLGKSRHSFKIRLFLSFSKGRNKESSYRIKWDKEFSVQLAKDYPKSFVRSLEFHIGDEYYKKKKFTEYDIGGFKEQLQVCVKWKNGLPKITIKEYFKVRKESQGFPNIYKELSSYLIADYLLSDEIEVLRRIRVSEWKRRSELHTELAENNIYLLLNREKGQIYVGETKLALSQRYPENQKHHSFDAWSQFCTIQLPPETSHHSRLLIERILIAVMTKLLPNSLSTEVPIIDDSLAIKLMNRKK
jgi:hypothetical protein